MSLKPDRTPLGILATALMSFALSVVAETGINSTLLPAKSNQVQVLWAANPSNLYVLQTTTNLSLPWQALSGQPSTFTAATNSLVITLPVDSFARFFKVVKQDREGPEVYKTSPTDGAFAVDQRAIITASLRDETGVDTNTITLAIGTNQPVDLSDSRLSWSAGQLTYTPATNELLGALGSTVSVKLSMADTLENVTTNVTWSFTLVLPPVLSSNIVFIDSGTGSKPAPKCSGLTLISTNADTFTYKYTGGSSGLFVGLQLVDPNRTNGYTRTVLSFTEYSSSNTVVALTQPAPLADLLQQGSLDSSTFTEVTAAGTKDGGAGIDLTYSLPLDGVLYQDSYVKVETLPGSHFNLDAKFNLTANFRNFSLTDFETTIRGTAEFQLDGHAIASIARDCSGEKALIAPIRKSYFGKIPAATPTGFLPVWVDVVFEVNVGYGAHWDAAAESWAGASASKEILIGRRWSMGNGLSDIFNNPPHSFSIYRPTWQIQGSGDLRVYLQPKVTMLVYSLAGVVGTLKPYTDLKGNVQLNPYRWDIWLHSGLDSSVGLNLRVWDKKWGELPSKTFTLIPQTLLWHTNSATNAPIIISQPQSQTVYTGGEAVFAVQAEGSEPMTYRWLRNGLYLTDDWRISGSQSSWLRITNAQISDAADYSVHVSNAYGWTNSATKSLGVVLPPSIPGMVWIPPGTFMMGSPDSEALRHPDETQHTVTLTKGFYMTRFEVTQREYLSVVGGWNPSHFYSLYRPVEGVSWFEAIDYCALLTARRKAEGLLPTGWAYRLPTEAEWEYACRAGMTTAFPYGGRLRSGMANFNGHYEYDAQVGEINNPFGTYFEQTTIVGSYQPNAFGLYDMNGNVAEWCQDWYGPYMIESEIDPTGPTDGSVRVIRGGAWYWPGRSCRSSDRAYFRPNDRNLDIGFRPVLAPE